MKHSCQQASRLVSDACERPLAFGERFRLRLHLLMCGFCRNYTRDIKLLNFILERLRNNESEPKVCMSKAERQRIKLALRAAAHNPENDSQGNASSPS